MIKYCRYRKLSAKTKEKCKKLTLVQHSWFARLLEGEYDKYRADRVHVWLMYAKDRIIGWATACYEIRADIDYNIVKCYLINVFVDPAYRQEGVGSKLIRRVKLQLKPMNLPLVGFPYNRASEALFKKHGIIDATFWDEISVLEDTEAVIVNQ